MQIARRLFKKASLLSRPTLARRDAPFPNKAAACEEANRTLCRTLSLWAMRERRWRLLSIAC